MVCPGAVSYTHLDVYKRQPLVSKMIPAGILIVLGLILLWQARAGKGRNKEEDNNEKIEKTARTKDALLWQIRLPLFGVMIQVLRNPCLLYTSYLAYSEMADIYWDTSYKRTLKATDSVAGISPLYKENVLEDIAAVRDEVDVVILTLHWGIEYQHLPESYQSQMAKDFIDAGADVIIGHHPHCIQGVETYHGGLIFYSLGNFIFDQDWSLQTRQGLALELELTPLG